MRLGTLLLSIAALAFAAPAAADGPVFTIVPTEPTAYPAVSSAPAETDVSGIQDELSADRRALARARDMQYRGTVALRRAEAAAASALLLSDRLAAEKAVFQLRISSDRAAARADQLRKEIESLESELHPVSFLAFHPFAAAASSSSLGVEAVMIAEQFLGVPYVWGGADPTTGFDCSGLTMYVYGRLGIPLPHYAAAQWNESFHIDPMELQAGDLVFFEPRPNGPGHVGIYAGGDSFIEAPHAGALVKITSLSQKAAALGFVGAARPAAAETATIFGS